MSSPGRNNSGGKLSFLGSSGIAGSFNTSNTGSSGGRPKRVTFKPAVPFGMEEPNSRKRGISA